MNAALATPTIEKNKIINVHFLFDCIGAALPYIPWWLGMRIAIILLNENVCVRAAAVVSVCMSVEPTARCR